MRARETSFGPPFQDFHEALRFLDKIPNYEKTMDWDYTPKKLDLSRVNALMDYLGNPQDSFNSIHVAGTKGKGSTATILATCLQKAGHRTGLYTSPHLICPTERAKVDGQNISRADFARLLGKVSNYVRAGRQEGPGVAPTYFETVTALAFDYFREREVDWAVVEVGLGGRLDSTNVLRPQCCVITPIGFDHTDKLGSDIAGIAREKAGILKKGIPVILGRQRYPRAAATLRRRAEELGCDRREVGQDVDIRGATPVTGSQGTPGWDFGVHTPDGDYLRLFTPLMGAHQLDNCAAATAALALLDQRERLSISPDQLRRGMAAVDCPARVQLLQLDPPLVLDTAHTVESVRGLLDALQVHFPGKAVNFVFGCSAGKDLAGMLSLLDTNVKLTATNADSRRALPAEEVARAAREAGMRSVRVVVPADRKSVV